MKIYQQMLADVMYEGVRSSDRTGTGTNSVFGRQYRFDLTKGFPLLTTKKMFWKGVVVELLWMLSGSTNIKPLLDQDVHIWDKWADGNGDLGPVYGKQWRDWWGLEEEIDPEIDEQYRRTHTDQIVEVIDGIKKDPYGRRHIVSAWNPPDIPYMKLPPCHCFFQFYVRDGKLSCQLYQRSADLFLGVPFNIASYALLTHLIARECGLDVGEFIHTFGDLHIYLNHMEQVREQIRREPLPLPKVRINTDLPLFELKLEHIELVNYQSHPAIKAEVSV
jgi:thymidylate synthase